MPSKLKDCNIVVIEPCKLSWKLPQVKSWIEQNSGSWHKIVHDDTTHVVTLEQGWDAQGPIIQEALRRKGEGQNIRVVNYYWLHDSLNKGRKSEGKYDWEKRDREIMGKRKHDVIGPKTISGLTAEMFREHTDQFVDHEEIVREKRRKVAEQKERPQQVTDDRTKIEQVEKAKKEQAKLFGKGAKHARNTLLTDLYHIYVDETGFTYDILLTRVDIQHNRNERFALTMFESHTHPSSYALSTHFAGTGIDPLNSVTAASGSRWETVWRLFRDIFKEKTQVDWEDRIKFSRFRDKHEQMGREVSLQEPDLAKKHNWAKILMSMNFKDTPFQYQIPAYGPRGTLPNNNMITEKAAGHASTLNNEQVSPTIDLNSDPVAQDTNEMSFDQFMKDHGIESGHSGTSFMGNTFDDAYAYPFATSARNDFNFGVGIQNQAQATDSSKGSTQGKALEGEQNNAQALPDSSTLGSVGGIAAKNQTEIAFPDIGGEGVSDHIHEHQDPAYSIHAEGGSGGNTPRWMKDGAFEETEGAKSTEQPIGTAASEVI